MIIRCIYPFGNFNPGDELEIADEAIFDKTYFEDAPVKGGNE